MKTHRGGTRFLVGHITCVLRAVLMGLNSSMGLSFAIAVFEHLLVAQYSNTGGKV
jgi:hypothetical protein